MKLNEEKKMGGGNAGRETGDGNQEKNEPLVVTHSNFSLYS